MWSSEFIQKGKASFIVGGQWGSEAKGAAAGWLAETLVREKVPLSIVTTNAGAQAGHTSYFNGKKRVVFHLPTVPLIMRDMGEKMPLIYLNAGAVIDPDVLRMEIEQEKLTHNDLFIHPMAAVITNEHREAEGRADSSQTKTASTRKGVGQALASKILRSATLAKDHPFLKAYVRRIDLNDRMAQGSSVLVEVPQGVSLSINHSKFYPHTTSRDCTPMAAMSDAGIHPDFYGHTMVVLRTFPIRVGNIVEGGVEVGQSGGHYPDQREVSWAELGVEAEITTVTKRIRRVFTYSAKQVLDTFRVTRPHTIFLAFCNYFKPEERDEKMVTIIRELDVAAKTFNIKQPTLITQWGPTNSDVHFGWSKANGS